MDTTTLVLANVLLFALCAGVMLVNARIVGGMRGALWFAASYLLRGVSMLLIGVSSLHLEPARFADVLSGSFGIGGLLLLHQSFAELLERKVLFRYVQFGLGTVMILILVYFAIFPASSPFPVTALCLTFGIQYALVAALVFRFSGEEVGPAGWLTGIVLVIHALIFFVRTANCIQLQGAISISEGMRTVPVGLPVCLVAIVATAFGFMSLSTARLRVELMWRAQVDDLTGLLNRWALKRMALREIQRCRRSDSSLAIVSMDLDGLKRINDTRGHSCGDVVLQAVAGVLQETVRVRDSVGRMGGDEFCVLLPDSSAEEAMRVAERLREEIADVVIRYRGEAISTRASLGVASSDISGLEWQSLIDDSDAALYRAKRDGKNRVVVATADLDLSSEAVEEEQQARKHPNLQ